MGYGTGQSLGAAYLPADIGGRAFHACMFGGNKSQNIVSADNVF